MGARCLRLDRQWLALYGALVRRLSPLILSPCRPKAYTVIRRSRLTLRRWGPSSVSTGMDLCRVGVCVTGLLLLDRCALRNWRLYARPGPLTYSIGSDTSAWLRHLVCGWRWYPRLVFGEPFSINVRYASALRGFDRCKLFPAGNHLVLLTTRTLR